MDKDVYKQRIQQALADSFGQAKPARPERKKKPSGGRTDLNARTKDFLKQSYPFVYRADHYDHAGGVSRDLFGIFDYVALGPGATVGVQTTSRSNMAARRTKIKESMAYRHCKGAGWDILLLGWAKSPATGRWEVKEEWL